jgi:hypothetical protein
MHQPPLSLLLHGTLPAAASKVASRASTGPREQGDAHAAAARGSAFDYLAVRGN